MDIAEEDSTLSRVQEILWAGGIGDPQCESERIVHAARRISRDALHERALAMARKRASGSPLSYVLGRQRFMGIEIAVKDGVLIPRSETELLGWEAVARLREASSEDARPVRVIDMCCGSGNLACGIAQAVPKASVWASDLMEDCALLALRNIHSLGFEGRVHVTFGDLFAPLEAAGVRACDVVVCNPPYISSSRLHRERRDLLTHEPRQAFDGGPYGLSIYQRLVHEAAPFLRPGGSLLLEMGVGQAPSLERLLKRCGHYDRVELVPDPQGELRVAAARRL